MNDYNLIKLVESFPILYDKDSARGQKNAARKDAAWKEVSMKLDASERACITRWKSIRDRFGKEYRRVQENPEDPTNWDIFPHLLFLKDHYKHGNASNAAVDNIKYEPRIRKRKLCTHGGNTSLAEDESNNDEDDMDPEDLIANQQLIALVREHPVLYDKKKIRDSKNLTAKNDSWREISESLGISEEICYRRWKKLRDRFAREYRHQKLNPETPVMWTYFQDLMFLEEHYRKGIPLPIEAMKRKRTNNDSTTSATTIITTTTATTVDPWGSDFPNEYKVDEQTVESVDVYDMPTNTLDGLLILSNKKEELQQLPEDTFIHRIDNTACSSVNVTEPEVQLTNVISTMENVLRKSHDCLKSLREQQERHKQELEDNAFINQPQMMQKVNLLLDGLSAEHRNRAERKILHFLCECQIKSLNNEDIEDVTSDEIY